MATKKNSFGDPQKVFDVCKSMQDAESTRASDRVKIDRMFNGKRPWSPEDEKKHQIQLNVNWGEGKRIMRDANGQLNNAMLHPGILFNCAAEEGRLDKRDEWSTNFTNLIHKPIQRGKSGKLWNFTIQSRNASICMHGIGNLHWPNGYRWRARFVPIEDLLIPTDTYCDFSNLRYFAVNMYLTPGELVDMTQGDKVVNGWNQKMIRAILDAHRRIFTESTPSTWRDQPEAMAQVVQQNKGWYYSDAVPKIKLRAFYWQEVDEPKKWYKHIVLREGMENVKTDDFVYDGSGMVFADDIDHILNVQYGDGNLVAPLKYHSVRGLGVDLFAPVETLNRLRCEYVLAVFEHLKMYFKLKDPADRDRLKQVVLEKFGFVPDGLEIVPQQQRHQINPQLVDDAMAQLKVNMQEVASSRVIDTDKGQQREMTAKEATIKLNQATQMVSGMLQNMYLQEAFLYEELVRRFLMPNPSDPEVKKFQEDCIRLGIPKEMLVADKWRVVPERVLGGGDRTLAQQEAAWLLQNKNLYDPQAQTKILRLSTSTMLNDPAKAMMLVPTAPPEATDGTYAAENVFGTMMQGIPVKLRTGIDQIGYIERLLEMMNMVVQRIQSADNMGTPQDLIGLVVVASDVSRHLMILAGDEMEKQRVKQYGDLLGNMMNEVKAFAQRQSQAQEAQQPEISPQDKAKAQATIMNAQIKGQIQAQRSAQKQREQMIAFELEQSRENLRTLSEIRREDLSHKQQMLNDSFTRTIQALKGNGKSENSS